MTFEEYKKVSTTKLSVYEVEVKFTNVKGYKGKSEKGEYFKIVNVLATNEEAAIEKAKRMLHWEYHEKLDNRVYDTHSKCKLLVENVEY